LPTPTPPSTTTSTTSPTASPTLNCQQNIPSNGPSPSDVALALTENNQVASICASQFDSSSGPTKETFNHGDLNIEITRPSPSQSVGDDCPTGVNNIIQTCIIGSGDYGGTYKSSSGIVVNITNMIYPGNPLVPGVDTGASSTTLPPTSTTTGPAPAPSTTTSANPGESSDSQAPNP
jgi:hypothetical protein